jgi:hypothetical protein
MRRCVWLRLLPMGARARDPGRERTIQALVTKLVGDDARWRRASTASASATRRSAATAPNPTLPLLHARREYRRCGPSSAKRPSTRLVQRAPIAMTARSSAAALRSLSARLRAPAGAPAELNAAPGAAFETRCALLDLGARPPPLRRSAAATLAVASLSLTHLHAMPPPPQTTGSAPPSPSTGAATRPTTAAPSSLARRRTTSPSPRAAPSRRTSLRSTARPSTTRCPGARPPRS